MVRCTKISASGRTDHIAPEHYFLNGQLIYPNSVKLEIADSLNNIQNLNQYGIDEDDDGIADPGDRL